LKNVLLVLIDDQLLLEGNPLWVFTFERIDRFCPNMKVVVVAVPIAAHPLATGCRCGHHPRRGTGSEPIHASSQLACTPVPSAQLTCAPEQVGTKDIWSRDDMVVPPPLVASWHALNVWKEMCMWVVVWRGAQSNPLEQ
jgi:hypothetical protein